jgi:hypothetical protein
LKSLSLRPNTEGRQKASIYFESEPRPVRHITDGAKTLRVSELMSRGNSVSEHEEHESRGAVQPIVLVLILLLSGMRSLPILPPFFASLVILFFG